MLSMLHTIYEDEPKKKRRNTRNDIKMEMETKRELYLNFE